MSSRHDPQKRIPLGLFRRMLQTMSPQELRRLPVQSLPEEIPLEVIEQAPPALRSVLEDLSFAVSSQQLGRWREDEEGYGTPVAAALERSDQRGWASRAQNLSKAVQALAAQWRERVAGQAVDARPFVVRLDELAPEMREVRAESGRLMEAVDRLDEALGEYGEVDRLREGRVRLSRELEHVEQSLADYHMLVLEIVRSEMRRQREQIEDSSFEDEQIQKRLDLLHDRLEKSQSFLRRNLRPRVARQERERLQQRITELLGERNAREWVIAESDMTRWLDGVVDASLYVQGAEQEHVLRDGRLQLYQLLNLFCGQQERAAQQVARNPFMQLDPQQAIEFLLISERFILGYFARKRGDVTRWLGGAAQHKLEDLDRVQAQILDEFRRHRHHA